MFHSQETGLYIIHTFQPEAVESSGGLKLIRKSDVNIGAHVNTFFRTGIRIHDGSILGTTPSRYVFAFMWFFLKLLLD